MNFWKNKKVLITGYEGFLGSHLTKTLIRSGAKVVGLDILVRRKTTILSNADFKRMNIIRGSVTRYDLIKNILADKKPEFIFHLAAKALVGDCYVDPRATFSTNIEGTWNVLEAARNAKSIKGIIVASSDKAYGSQKVLPYKEDSPLAGNHPYDTSKSCADLIAQTYAHTYKLPVCITRCGNIFGPGDFNFSRIIPDTIRCALSGKTLLIRSNGKYKRDYIYVNDIVGGYCALAQKMYSAKISGEAFNFSNEKPFSVLNLVRTIYRLIGKSPAYTILNQGCYEIQNQYLSSRKSFRAFSWKPEYTLQQGLQETIAWYQHALRGLE